MKQEFNTIFTSILDHSNKNQHAPTFPSVSFLASLGAWSEKGGGQYVDVEALTDLVSGEVDLVLGLQEHTVLLCEVVSHCSRSYRGRQRVVLVSPHDNTRGGWKMEDEGRKQAHHKKRGRPQSRPKEALYAFDSLPTHTTQQPKAGPRTNVQKPSPSSTTIPRYARC